MYELGVTIEIFKTTKFEGISTFRRLINIKTVQFVRRFKFYNSNQDSWQEFHTISKDGVEIFLCSTKIILKLNYDVINYQLTIIVKMAESLKNWKTSRLSHSPNW